MGCPAPLSLTHPSGGELLFVPLPVPWVLDRHHTLSLQPKPPGPQPTRFPGPSTADLSLHQASSDFSLFSKGWLAARLNYKAQG